MVGLEIPVVSELTEADRILLERDLPFLMLIALDYMTARLEELTERERSEILVRRHLPRMRYKILKKLGIDSEDTSGFSDRDDWEADLWLLVNAAKNMTTWVSSELIRFHRDR